MKIKMKKNAIIFYLGLLVIMGGLYIYEYTRSASQEKINFIFLMHGADTGMLGIQSNELNSQTLLEGILCVNHVSDVSKVDLFMPDMGHGSSPPVISKADHVPSVLAAQKNVDYGCFNISKMEMFMPGLWQVRVFYKNDAQGVFDVNIAE